MSSTAPKPQDQNLPTAPEDKKPSASERFTNLVMQQYRSIGTPYSFTQREQHLIRNYFIVIDQMIVKSEAERLRKNASNSDHKYDNDLAYSWNTIDLPQLAQDLAHYARVGLDMMEDNTLFPIPYKASKANLYTVTLMEGYNGIRFQAEKYALDPFRAVTVEVIYENDIFKAVKKDCNNPVEGYVFEIPEPLDRGKPVGVFGYIEFEDPAKNKLVVFSKADVLKRKPKYASAEFWGGQKKTWEDGKQVWVELTGWVPEMFEKTMKREIYGSKRIPRDPDKIDASYQYIRQREAQYADIAIEAEIAESANGSPLQLPVALEPQESAPAQPNTPPAASVNGATDDPDDMIDPEAGF